LKEVERKKSGADETQKTVWMFQAVKDQVMLLGNKRKKLFLRREAGLPDFSFYNKPK
jgi:hypothetical protein